MVLPTDMELDSVMAGVMVAGVMVLPTDMDLVAMDMEAMEDLKDLDGVDTVVELAA